jgi:hypothetical protein
MRFFSAIKKRQDLKRNGAAIRSSNPYVLIPQNGEILWWRWEMVPEAEAIGALPKHEGLPVVMNKEECEAANGGQLPAFWGEVQCAWRSEAQKLAFYAKYPERFNRKEQSEYPSQDQVETYFQAWKKGNLLELLKEQEKENAPQQKKTEQEPPRK